MNIFLILRSRAFFEDGVFRRRDAGVITFFIGLIFPNVPTFSRAFRIKSTFGLTVFHRNPDFFFLRAVLFAACFLRVVPFAACFLRAAFASATFDTYLFKVITTVAIS